MQVPSRSNSPYVVWLFLLLPPLLWAGNFIAGRGARDDVPPATLAFARHLIAFLCLLPFAWPAMRGDLKRYWKLRWMIAGTAVTGMAGFNLLVYVGLHYTTAANGHLFNSTVPVLILLLGVLFFRQRVNARQAIGLLLSCLGVLVITLHGDPARLLALQFSRGDLLVLAGMASFALFSVWLQSVPADMDRVGLLGAQLGVSVLALLPLWLWELASGAQVQWNARAIGAMLYVGIVASVAANLLYMLGVASVGAARAGLFIHLIPVFGALMAVAMLGENLHAYHAVGMAAIIAGLVCTRMGDKKPAPVQVKATGLPALRTAA